MMTYTRLIVGDSNVARFWQASQLARPQLVGVPLKTVSCLDTLAVALSDVNDSFDFVVVSVSTCLVLEEASSSDVKGSSSNVFEAMIKHVSAAAKKAPRAEVSYFFAVKPMLSVLYSISCF